MIAWIAVATTMKITLTVLLGVKARVLAQDDGRGDDEDQTLGLEAQLGDPVEERDDARAARAEGGARRR